MYTIKPRTNRYISRVITTMKKTTLAILLLAASAAHAGPFQETMLKVDTCHEIGGFAEQFYAMRAAGQPKMPFSDDGSHMNMIFRYAVDYAWGDATDGKDANVHVTAKCLDNYDWAIGSDKMGMARPDKLHY